MWLPELPSLTVKITLGAMSLPLMFVLSKIGQGASWAMLVFVGATSFAQHQINVIDRYAMQRVEIIGTVQSADIGQAEASRFLVQVEQIEGEKLSIFERFTVGLYSTLPDSVAAGQRLQFKTTLRPAHGRMNDGSFDKARWAMANHILLEGRVTAQNRLSPHRNLRQQIIDRAKLSLADLPYADILLALAFGERGCMTNEHRQQLIATGTAHLMAISGLHIALASLLGGWLTRIGQVLLPVNWIGPRLPLLGGWLVAAMYVVLSGANPPALRAFLAITIWGILRCQQAHWRPWQSWVVIVAVLLLCDPLMILSTSFWLSCSAVAALILIAQWAKSPPPIHRQFVSRWGHKIVVFLRWQLGLMLLLAPLQIYWFQGVSITALLANLVAIPLVSFVTVPLILLAILTLATPLSVMFWVAADYSLTLVFGLLSWLDGGWITLQYTAILSSLTLILCVFAWRLGMLWRYVFAWLIVLCILWLPQWQGKPYRWRLDMLDVGHGLAVVIRVGQHGILFDTGAAWQGGSSAQQVILPFLNWHNVTLEGLIISHQDNDHAGGLPFLQARFPHAWLKTSDFSLPEQGCVAGQTWQWQGLHFQVLWPMQPVVRAYNPDSCVIKVSDGRFSILLTGDIGKAQEAELVRLYRQKLVSTVLQVPHHGSATSSSPLFLRTVKPKVALSGNGRFSPWRLPHPQVKWRYSDQGSEWFSTDRQGQISVQFYDKHYEVNTYYDRYRRWYRR